MIAARRQDDNVYEVLSAVNPNALVARGLSEAYIGHSTGRSPVAVYDYETCVEVTMRARGMNYSQAVDYLSEHVVPDSHGPNMPIFVMTT
jgi:hypothetical protein